MGVGQVNLLVAILAAAPNIEEVSLAAWIVAAGFVVLEAYFFAALLRAWIEDRHTRIACERSRTR